MNFLQLLEIRMPTTRQQEAEARRVGVCLTLDDTARTLTRVSGSLHSIANFINETIEARPGFFERFRRSGEKSSANARALWRFHDRRWKSGEGANNEDDDNEDDGDDTPIDDEVDQRIGSPFSFTRAVEVGINYLETAREALQRRKDEMRAWNDDDGAEIMDAFIISYDEEIRNWSKVREHLGRCSTYLGESFLDSSIRYGWL